MGSIHEKNTKISWHCHFNGVSFIFVSFTFITPSTFYPLFRYKRKQHLILNNCLTREDLIVFLHFLSKKHPDHSFSPQQWYKKPFLRRQTFYGVRSLYYIDYWEPKNVKNIGRTNYCIFFECSVYSKYVITGQTRFFKQWTWSDNV